MLVSKKANGVTIRKPMMDLFFIFKFLPIVLAFIQLRVYIR